MLTDGMLEGRAQDVDLEGLIVRAGDLHPREAARTVIAKVIAANDGHLRNDATIMCLHWHGVRALRQYADRGAQLADASPSPAPAP
ncbi:SpoIIE family protein phosphatase [Streptomyces sp. NPDC003015]